MQYLYLIKCQQFYKIGVANDVENRLAQLSTGNPFELRVLAIFGYENAECVERALHQKFANRRERGEWFSLDNAEVEVLAEICDTLGGVVPDSFATSVSEYDLELTEIEEASREALVKGHSWRLERRNDRTPPGFAIYQRGKPIYLGYIGANTLKDPDNPTAEEVERMLKK
jgi:FKBP-type peptidyl-prolyl cis-trans isomerase 2